MIANAMPQTTNPIPPINWQLTALGILAIPHKERKHLERTAVVAGCRIPASMGKVCNVSTVNVDVAVNGGKIISNIHSQWTHYVISPCKNYHTSCCKNYCYFTLARMYFIDFLHGENCDSPVFRGPSWSAVPALLTGTKRNFECFKKSR